jgi:signal transduction histidine kinase
MPSVNDLLFSQPETEQVDERSKSEIRMEYLIKQGFSKDNIEMKTDLTSQAIKAISKGLLHASIFSDSTIKQLCDTVMVLNVSKNRKGRQELTELTRVANDTVNDEQQTALSRLLG